MSCILIPFQRNCLIKSPQQDSNLHFGPLWVRSCLLNDGGVCGFIYREEPEEPSFYWSLSSLVVAAVNLQGCGDDAVVLLQLIIKCSGHAVDSDFVVAGRAGKSPRKELAHGCAFLDGHLVGESATIVVDVQYFDHGFPFKKEVDCFPGESV